MTVNIDKEVECSFDFDENEVIKKAIIGTIEYMKFPYDPQVNVLVTDNEHIRIINNEYRQIDRATDVLSFPMIEYYEPGDFSVIENDDKINTGYVDMDTGEVVLGDIVLSVDKIREQAIEYGHSTIREMSFLVVHSMLHLFGYDHMDEEDKTMEKLQHDILDNMGIRRE